MRASGSDHLLVYIYIYRYIYIYMVKNFFFSTKKVLLIGSDPIRRVRGTYVPEIIRTTRSVRIRCSSTDFSVLEKLGFGERGKGGDA
jgi:hypothetical protein